jgi:hypothetical protein
MENKSKTTAPDFFIYLGIIIGLYVSTVSLISLCFDLINKWLPDVGSYFSYSNESVRLAIAALIIFFPVYIYLSRVSSKAVANIPDKNNIWVRRWFFFLTLFLTGLAIAVDLSTLVYRFIGGEDLTLRFILKVLVVFLVAVSIFRFYFYELRRDVTLPTPKRKYLSYSASLIVLIIVGIGVSSIGSPTTQRNIRFDEQRISDLSSIQGALIDYYRNNDNILPKDLLALSQASGYYIASVKDPQSNENYEYRIISDNKYELCASFATDNQTEELAKRTYYNQEIWKHGVGRTCFSLTAGESKK